MKLTYWIFGLLFMTRLVAGAAEPGWPFYAFQNGVHAGSPLVRDTVIELYVQGSLSVNLWK